MNFKEKLTPEAEKCVKEALNRMIQAEREGREPLDEVTIFPMFASDSTPATSARCPQTRYFGAPAPNLMSIMSNISTPI